MDRVKDESPPLEKRAISFLNENGEMLDPEKASQNGETDLSTIDWDKHPPVADIKVDTSYLKQRKVSDRTKACFRAVSVVTVVVVISTFWLMMLIPHFCYFQVICNLDSGDTGSGNPMPPPVDSSNITCSRNIYSGVCQNHFNSCSNSLINLNPSSTTEQQLGSLFAVLTGDGSVSSSCAAAVGEVQEFLCRYSYQPCDSTNRTVMPTRGQCEKLKDVDCRTEWQFLQQGSFGSLLPDCSSLPTTETVPNCTVSASTTTTSVVITATPTPMPSPIVTGSGSGPSECTLTYTQSTCASYLKICPAVSVATINTFDASIDSSIGSVGNFLTIASQTCQSAEDMVLRFLCQVSFQPCDSDSQIHLPNRTTCETIRDTLCPGEWTNINNLPQFNGLLPDCSLLPAISVTPSCVSPPVTSSPTPMPSPSPSPNSNVGSFNGSLTMFQCNEAEGFYLYLTDDNTSTINNTCQPRCDEWIMFESQTAADLRDYMTLAVSMVGLVAAFAVIFFSLIRYKRMLVFPSIYILYQTIVLIVLGVTVLIQFTARFPLSCSPDNLALTTLSNPTPFCKFSGFVFMYTILALTYWWLAHVSSTFWKVMFPFHARAHENKTKYIHAISLVLGIILPAIAPLAAEFESGYFVHRFPPLLCVPRNSDVLYIGVIIPINIALCIGLSFLVIILHVLHQKQRLFKHRGSLSYFLGLSTAEKKLLIIFFYYMILGILDITGFTISTATLASTTTTITNKFLCEARPYDPTFECSRDFLDLALADSFAIVIYILLGLFPFVNLLFAINLSEVKASCRKCLSATGSGEFRSRTMSTSAVGDTPDTPFTLRRKISYSVTRASESKRSIISSQTVASAGSSGGNIGRNGVYTQRTTNM